MEKGHLQLRRTKIKTAQVKSQGDSFFPTDGHQAILNNDGAIIKSEAQPTGVQLKRPAKLLT